MNDEQFKQFMTIEMAKLALLQGIMNAINAVSMDQKKAGLYNWTDLDAVLKSAATKADSLKS